eukprot:8338424-Lingulodinium_polyedra.AAC.1
MQIVTSVAVVMLPWLMETNGITTTVMVVLVLLRITRMLRMAAVVMMGVDAERLFHGNNGDAALSSLAQLPKP